MMSIREGDMRGRGLGRSQNTILEKLFYIGPMKSTDFVKSLDKKKGSIGNSLKSLRDRYKYVYIGEDGFYHITPLGASYIKRGVRYTVEKEKTDAALDDLIIRAEAIGDEKIRKVIIDLMIFLKNKLKKLD